MFQCKINKHSLEFEPTCEHTNFVAINRFASQLLWTTAQSFDSCQPANETEWLNK